MSHSSIRVAENAFGRWIIVHSTTDDLAWGTDDSLAWSGSRWVPHYHGIPASNVQVSNFATREEAQAYADEYLPGIASKEER